MSRKFGYPRNEASRRDRIQGREIIKLPARNHKARNDMIANNPHGIAGLALALTGTLISGGALEAEIVTGSETLILTLTNGEWHPSIGSDNAQTTALIDAITGDDAGSNGWEDEMSLAFGNVTLTSASVVTITLPAAGSYSIAAIETVTVAPPASTIAKGVAPSSQAFDISIVLAVLTGTIISGGSLEAEIVAGSETLIITLTDDTWVATVGSDNAITTALIAGITGDDTGSNGWDDEVAIVFGSVTRDSNTQVTIVVPSAASYAIAADETVTVAIPAIALTGGVPPASSTFDVSIVTAALTGTAIAGGVLESEIVSGSETIIITLTDDTWVATIGADNAITDALIAGITGDDGGANGWGDEVAILFGTVVRTSNTVVTITLPSAGSYSVASNEIVTVALPATALTGGVPAADMTFTITEGS